jgi:hypothetical protein
LNSSLKWMHALKVNACAPVLCFVFILYSKNMEEREKRSWDPYLPPEGKRCVNGKRLCALSPGKAGVKGKREPGGS